MKYLLDTHILLWAAVMPMRLSALAKNIINNPDNECFFSAASLWEIVIKNGLGRPDFSVEPSVLRRALLDHNYFELPIHSEHTIMVSTLPPLHKDPFDRILIAQAIVEGMVLLTADTSIAQYSGPIECI